MTVPPRLSLRAIQRGVAICPRRGKLAPRLLRPGLLAMAVLGAIQGSLSGPALAQPLLTELLPLPTLVSPTPHFSLPAASSTPDLRDSYILGPGDQVAIVVIGYEEFNGTRVILPDGTIALPLIGSLDVAGQTVDDVTRQLTLVLRQYLTNPVVSISLATLRPVAVTVAGEVYRPGPLQLSSLTNVNQQLNTDSTISAGMTSIPTLSQALIAAGGVRRAADIRSVTVRRSLSGGQVQTLHINLWEALTAGTVASDLILRDGDTIFVPQVAEGTLLDQQLLASSTLAPERVRVRVVGEVNNPGEVQIAPNSSVSSTVAIAGGPTPDARLSQVTLIRRDLISGEIQEQAVDLRRLVDDFQIQDGDVVWVPQQPYLTTLDAVGRVTQTFFPPLGLINLLQNIGIIRRNN